MSVQLVPAPKATFFGDFLFCQKRKLPPAGQAFTPQTTEEPTSQRQSTNNKQHRSQMKAQVVEKMRIKKGFSAISTGVNSYELNSNKIPASFGFLHETEVTGHARPPSITITP